MPSRLLLFAFYWLILYIAVLGQRASDTRSLERKKNEKLEAIREKDKMLRQINNKKQNNVSKLHIVREQISVQKKFILALKEELASLEAEIAAKSAALRGLESELKALKQEYASMVYGMSKTHSAYKKMLYLFSSDSFNQLYKRLQYFSQYQMARKHQFAEIQKLSASLLAEQDELNERRKAKQALLDEKLGVNTSLKKLENNSTQLVRQLSKEEQQIRVQIAQDKKVIADLESAISQMIRREMSSSTTSASSTTPKVSAPKETQLTTRQVSFVKGRLIFPVKKGAIVEGFGKHEHPVLQGVTIENNGVEIETPPNEAVYAVAEGKVTAVAQIPAMAGQVVMIQHGAFFSVYAKVHSVRVRVGQLVKGGQYIAHVSTDEKGDNRLQLQLWQGSEKLNPSIWLSVR